jgi:hypothetical protein
MDDDGGWALDTVVKASLLELLTPLFQQGNCGWSQLYGLGHKETLTLVEERVIVLQSFVDNPLVKCVLIHHQHPVVIGEQ